MKLGYGIFLLTSLMVFSSCTNNSGGGGASTGLGVGGTILQVADKALQTSGELIDTGSSSSLVSVRADSCPNFGSSQESTADSIYCMITTDSGSPETARGALSLISQIMRGLESKINFQYGSTPTNHDPVTFSVQTSDGNASVVSAVREQALSNSVWDKKIDICIISFNGSPIATGISDCESNRFFYTIYLKQSASVLAFKGVQRMDPNLIETVLFYFDSSSGELRYNSWSLQNGNQHRYYVKGVTSSNGAFTTIDKAAFAHSRASYDDENNPAALANWSAAYAFYNGSDLCINYKTSSSVNSNWTIAGDCTGKMPVYNDNFHAFTTQASALRTFSENDAKGILNFNDTTLTVSSFFIDN